MKFDGYRIPSWLDKRRVIFVSRNGATGRTDSRPRRGDASLGLSG
jgi:hypothetical protein